MVQSVVIFGAGSIGRGFVGALFSGAGWSVTFVDISPPLVERLHADHGYNQIIVSDDEELCVRVAPVEAFLLDDAKAVHRALLGADMVATSVGSANLPAVASVVADTVIARARKSLPPLDVLLCENLQDAPVIFRDLMTRCAEGVHACSVGLVATCIGRMVPTPVPNAADPTRVSVEPYAFLQYDAAALVGPQPDVPGLVPVEEGFAVYADRKLYLHNMAHCVLAYLGDLRQYEYVWQASADPELRHLTTNAMVEVAAALSVTHGVPLPPLLHHVNDLLARFGNRALRDTTARVGRDPLRKMQPAERFLGSYGFCRRAGVTPLYISIAVALGASRLAEEDGWDGAKVMVYLSRHLFHDNPDERLSHLLREDITSISGGLDVPSLLHGIDESYFPSRIP